MKKFIAFTVAILFLFSVSVVFAGGAKEKTGKEQKKEATTEKAEPQKEAPKTKEAKEAEAGIKKTRFEGLKDIDYSAWEIGKPGGTIVVTTLGDPKSFNALIAAETSTTDIINRVYDAPVDRNNLTLEWEPELVKSWKISDDNLSAVFTMREGLKWSDGQPLTAEDVVFTVNDLIMNKKVQNNMIDAFYVGDKLAKVELLDKMRFKVTLPSLYAGLFNMMSIPVMPKHIIEPLIKEKGAEAFNSFWGVDTDVKSIVGCGPFVVDEYVPGQKIVLKKNPYYWKKDAKGQQLPYLDKIVYLIVEDQNTAILKFQAGETDIYGLRGEDYATLVNKKKELDFELYNGGPAAGTNFLVFNENPAGLQEPKLSWFNDRRFRKAMAHLIDRETIINNVQYGFGFPQYSFIPTFSPYYWPGVEDLAPKYDPEAAKKLLDEMGLIDRNGDGIREDKDGNKVSFVLQTNSNNTVRVTIGEMFAQEAKKIGVDVTFKPGDFNALVTALLKTYKWDAIIIGLTGSVDPISGANVYPSSGNLHMIEPRQKQPRREWEKEVDKWWNYANLTLDENKRKEGFMHIQKIWIEELPWIYTTNPAVIYAYKNKIGNVKPRPVTRGFNGICEYVYIK